MFFPEQADISDCLRQDGNGRLSRILASIPLLKHQLPPLCIPSTYKKPYNKFLNFVRLRSLTYRYILMSIIGEG